MKNPLHKQMISIFNEWYLAEKKIKYNFLPAQCKAIDLIYTNIIAMYGDKTATDEGVLNTFKYLLTNMKATYEWLYDNCDITVINSKFNILADKAKSKKASSIPEYDAAKSDILNKLANYGKQQ